jgi:hypothetical protein
MPLSGGDQRPLRAVQLVEFAFQHHDARRALGHRQRVIGHPLDLAHDEGKHSVGVLGRCTRTTAEQNLLLMPLGCPVPLQPSPPSMTHGGQPRSRGVPRSHDNGLLGALQPVNLAFEFGICCSRSARGHGVFAIWLIATIKRSASTSG